MAAYYSALRLLVNAGFRVASGWKVVGSEHVPARGGLIIASNHISFLDPPIVGAASPRDTYFLAKEELFRPPLFGPLIRFVHAIPIRRGVADLSGMSRALDLLRRGEALVLFPEGSRMRDGELHPARPGVGMLSVNADVPIVPCYVWGTNRPGQWWNRRVRPWIAFGEPRHWRDLAGPESDLTPGRALYQRVSDAVMREIATLKTGHQDMASRGAVMSRTQSS